MLNKPALKATVTERPVNVKIAPFNIPSPACFKDKNSFKELPRAPSKRSLYA